MLAGPWLYVVSIFSSAFLIFGVQPMVGKHILPWFGGAPSVWMTCLAFYQTALFLGYAYAYGLAARVPLRLQPVFHGLLFAASLAVLPVLPADAWRPTPDDDSTLRILNMLTANVALPFVLLAATGPLLQFWFARALPGRSPYVLYAVSNVGSLLGLLSFPFLVEPSLPLSSASRLWSWSFAVTGVAVLACAVRAARSAPGPSPASPSEARESIELGRLALWILFPASAVMMFMGVTNQLCLDVASVPFLWIVPLSVYLITLVLSFASERIYRREVFVALAIVSLAWLLVTTAHGPAQVGVSLAGSWATTAAVYCAALFFGCMVAHGELHRLRPGPSRLTAFYLCIAGGGALGGLFVGLAAPRIFSVYRELPLGVAVCWVSTWAAIRREPTGLFAGRARRVAWACIGLATGGAASAWALEASAREPGTVLVERDFFGILRVIETPGTTPFVVLRHGTTRHGLQYRNLPLRRIPTSYYGQATGVGLLLSGRRETRAGPLQLGVVGLGIGTLAAYGREGDQIVFYEIDPEVVRIARDSGHFTYLGDSPAQLEVVLGDARLSLEAELAQRGSRGFDVLVLDAFTSDSIPIHLLTVEAFRIYAAHLAEGGVLAVHVSNRSFDLAAPVARLGREVGLGACLVVNEDAPRLLSEAARWVLLSADPARCEGVDASIARLPRRAGRALAHAVPLGGGSVGDASVWTDDFSNLLGLLRYRQSAHVRSRSESP